MADKSTSDEMTPKVWQEVESHRDIIVAFDALDARLATCQSADEKKRVLGGALTVLNIRRQLLNLERQIRKANGLQRRQEAEIIALRTRLEKDNRRRAQNETLHEDEQSALLTPAQEMDIQGRVAVAVTEAEFYQEVVEQLQMEQQVWRRMLPGEGEAWPSSTP